MKTSKKMAVMASVLMLSFTVFMAGCSKDDDNGNGKGNPQAHLCETCPSAPEALAEHDSSSKGIYKGVVIGSSGTIKFNVANNNSDITAILTLDGETYTLTSDVTWENGQSYDAWFTGEINGQMAAVNFYVKANGTEPQILSSNIPGHPSAVFTLVKETSDALIEGYEGTFSKTNSESGTFNILVSRVLGKWGGISRENGTDDIDNISGTISADGTLKDLKHNYTVGKLTGETISGTFTENNGIKVTISAYRTL